MKLLKFSKIKNLATNTCSNTINGFLNSKHYTTQSIQPKKSFLIKKTEPKVDIDIPTKSFLNRYLIHLEIKLKMKILILIPNFPIRKLSISRPI